MKKKLFPIACAIALSLGLTSCGAVEGVMSGAIFTNHTVPVAITSNVVGTKVGRAQTLNVLGLVTTGNGGINKAAKSAGITRISHVDKQAKSVLGLYVINVYTVYGE